MSTPTFFSRTSNASTNDPATALPPSPPARPSLTDKKGLKFKLILCTLFVSLFLSAMDFTAMATALPAMIESLHGKEFLWVSASYSLAATAFLPMSGGVAEVRKWLIAIPYDWANFVWLITDNYLQIFGRQPAMLLALGLFAFGSALCGSAQNMTWLIGGRTVQGLGGGAIQSLTSIIISDLVSLQERGTYNAIVGLAWAFASAIGPLVGGSLADRGQWRWLFYLNLPICGLAIVAVLLILRLPTPQGTIRSKLQKMDWIGNFLIIASTTVFIIGLSWGGAAYSWSSAQVLTTLIVGFLGFGVFLVYEAKWAVNPIVPVSILSNRSSMSGYIQNFLAFFVLIAFVYFLAVFLQACKDTSPMKAGVVALGPAISVGLAVIISGMSVTITKRYRPQLYAAWVLVILGFGLMIPLDSESTFAHIIGVTVLPMVGIGALASAGYFPVLAPLDVTQNAYALAFFAFGRTFAGVWGISIGNTIFQNELRKRLHPELIQSLGSTFSHNVEELYAFLPQIRFLNQPAKGELQEVFADSVGVIWAVMTGIGGLGLFASFLMRDIPLQNVRDDKWTNQAKTGEDRDLEGGVHEGQLKKAGKDGQVVQITI
ncbi:hypothetical protein AAF712_016693 [Marasmius tenuissimus]|uniref:Major facilitator superfamily (MFS) profile domain-containing protein n=1 Tax=Marasmius tenuissimus TaxID=585030 RepID=A0ABR2Z778_9AGAR